MIKNITILVLDVDGTLTDGKLYIGENGEVFKAFNVKDGCGIKDILPKYNIKPIIVTARKSKILEQRCKELNITELYQGVTNKIDFLKTYIDKHGINPNEIAYIGDDITDLECMHFCGVSGCPSDAVNNVKNVSDYICNAKGGEGAVREFVEYLISR